MPKPAALVPDLPHQETVESRYRWVADNEAAEVYNLPRDEFRRLCMMYDADRSSGFPRKHAMLKRRWLPALDDFFNATNRPKILALRSTEP